MKEIGFEGGGRHWEPWWRQAEVERHLKDMLKRNFGGSMGAVATGIWKELWGKDQGGGIGL